MSDTVVDTRSRILEAARRRLLAGFASIVAVAGAFGLRSATARYYDGPVSDHFDGTRFFDLHGVPMKSVPKALYDQWLWYRDGDRQKWPERARRGQAEDFRQERGRRVPVAGVHDGMIQLDQGSAPLPPRSRPL